MKWEGRKETENVEDRRGLGKKAGLAIGGGGGLLLVLLALLLGVDPQQLANLAGPGPGGVAIGQPNGQEARRADPEEERMAAFSKVVFNDTEEVWDELFRGMNKQYQKPVLVLFSG